MKKKSLLEQLLGKILISSIIFDDTILYYQYDVEITIYVITFIFIGTDLVFSVAGRNFAVILNSK